MSCLVLAASPSIGLQLRQLFVSLGTCIPLSAEAGKGGPWLQGLEGPGKPHVTSNGTALGQAGAQCGHLQPGGRWDRGTQRSGLRLTAKHRVNPHPDHLALFSAVSGKPRGCGPKLLHLPQTRLTTLCPKQAWLP